MSLYLPIRKGASVSIGICSRCKFKFHYDDLVKDPNTGAWVCKDDQDLYDPWRIAARHPENITLTHPRPDADISTLNNQDYILGSDSSMPIEFPDYVEIDTAP